MSSNGDIFLQWVEALASTPNPPLVHSMSYASIAPEDPKFDVERFNTEMCKLGLKGLTLFVASGDDGVANFQVLFFRILVVVFSFRNAGSQLAVAVRLHPEVSIVLLCFFLLILRRCSFPATSPYATTVGATQGPEMGSAEIACSSNTNGLITTGGGAPVFLSLSFLTLLPGFSTYVKRPDWQDQAVHNYLNGPNQVQCLCVLCISKSILVRFPLAPCSRRRAARK